jgi:amidohydrolase
LDGSFDPAAPSITYLRYGIAVEPYAMPVALLFQKALCHMPNQFADQISRVLPDVVAFRRDLHAHPELSQKEHRTAEKVREVLGRLRGVQVLPPLIGTDVVAVLNTDRPGPCIALRADTDALPVQEETGVAYQSTVPGVMHACGHDGHTAILLATALVLSQVADSLPGKVKFIFQPDEEGTGGGGHLCERGVLDSPKVDGIVALHAWPLQPLGTIAQRRGTATAANSPFTITVRGLGGHGAYPHRTVDPIVISAHIITAIQTIVARTVDPLDSAVATVGRISAGAAGNVIPPECLMEGTMRYLRPETGERMCEQLRRIVQQTAQAHGAQAEVTIEKGYPPLFNDPKMAELVESVTCDLQGKDNLITSEPPSMGVEDFGFYAQRVPAAMFRLGLRPRDVDSAPHLHSPSFNFNDDALPIGMSMFCEIVRRFLAGGG